MSWLRTKRLKGQKRVSLVPVWGMDSQTCGGRVGVAWKKKKNYYYYYYYYYLPNNLLDYLLDYFDWGKKKKEKAAND